jgi:hypothetical protein
MSEKQNFNDSVMKLLETKLKVFIEDNSASLNKETCVKIYVVVFDALVELFQKSNVTLTNEAMNYVAQMYYDSISINKGQELDPNIFDQRAKLENIDTKELAFLATMYRGTDYVYPFVLEIKKRS